MLSANRRLRGAFGSAEPRVNVAGTLLLVLLLFLTGYPLLMLLYGSLRSAPPGLPGTLSLGGFATAYGDPLTYQTWGNSLLLAGSTTVLSTALAIFFAFTATRTDAPLRGQILPIMTLTYFVPTIFLAFAWTMLGNPRAGLINVVLMDWFPGLGPVLNVYSWPGLVLVMSLSNVPFKFLLLLGAFQAMDRALEEAAHLSGAGRVQTMLRVNLPILAPTILGVLLLGFVRGLQAFEVPLFLGFPAKIQVLSTRIYDYVSSYSPPRYAEAGALSVSVVATLIVLVYVQARLLHGRDFVTVTGKGYRPGTWRLGKAGYLCTAAIVLYALFAFLLPAVQLFLGSFTKVFGLYSWQLFTFDNYAVALSSDLVRRAILNTLLLAVVGGALAMVFATAVAYVVARTNYRLRPALDLAIWVPWTLPGVVLGVAMLWAYLSVPGLRSLYGTPWLLLIGVMVTVLPVGMRVMAGSLVQLGKDLEEGARVHGASWPQTLARVVAPLVAPSFLYGWLVVAVIISGELSVPLLLYAPGTETLSIAILQLQTTGKPEAAAAVFSLVLLAATVLIVLARAAAALLDRWQAGAVTARSFAKESVVGAAVGGE
ncbi:MAG TPA: iron ABC transporter permease [Chloroflexota bacterium]